MTSKETLEDHYKHALASAVGNLGRRGDQYIIGTNTEELIEFYYNMYSLPEISLTDKGEPQVISEGPSRSHQKAGLARVKIRFGVEPANKIQQALKLKSAQISANEVFKTDDNDFYVTDDLSPSTAKEQIEKHKETLRYIVDAKNQEIRMGNQKLRSALTKIIEERKSNLKAQEETLRQISKVIPLTLNPKPSAPIVPLAKKQEIKINPPQPKLLIQPKIDHKILNAIIDILIRGGKTFETTPGTFSKLDEPDLRNILISYLNGNFKLHATAEAFNKLGKTDISLRYSGDNLFVAECKFWGGSTIYSETIDQLFRYLTWRENLGVILCFVKERDFTSIIEKAKNTTKSHKTYVQNSLREKSDSYFVTKHIFPEDRDKTVDIHHILFTIFVPKS